MAEHYDVFVEFDEFLVVDMPNGAVRTVGMVEEEDDGSFTAVCARTGWNMHGFGTLEEVAQNIMYVEDRLVKRAAPRPLIYTDVSRAIK